MPDVLSNQNCLVLVSGGLDSAACVVFCKEQGNSVFGLHISYGQPAAKQEQEAASIISRHFNIELRRLDLSGSRMKKSGVIQGRNAFLLVTAMLEMQVSSSIVVIGVHSGTPYIDCSVNFINKIQSIYDDYFDGRIRVVAPFLDWTKKEIIEYCSLKNIPFEKTYSCEKGSTPPCGECLSCLDREIIGVS
ncbi:7-cyano-7-deazaguanine synthase [Planctomycetota bacterium]